MIALHPLVIMNVAEHYTRTRAQESTPVDHQTAGPSRNGTTSLAKSEFVIDHTFYHQKEEQFKQVFPYMDFLGWYTRLEMLQQPLTLTSTLKSVPSMSLQSS